MQAGSNNPIAKYLKQIDALDDELASLRGSYMSQCKGPRAGIRELLGEVRESGENMKAFRVLLKEHRDERKAAKRREELESEDLEALEDLESRLGELASTPLGGAAMRRAGKKDSHDDLNA